ncbi:hypothetical protein FI667_g5163, partial [Globisporangium splendens]
MAILGSAVRWATSKVDESVVNPVTTRLVNSVANPYVMSYLIWDRIKKLTPQRARDVTRLISTAIANAVGVLGAEQGKALTHTTKKLQDEFVAAAVSTKGRDVILNTIATASKVAQALNTPETKVATTQVFETLQSLIDFFASPEGRKVISTAGECLNQFCEVAASAESSIFLAEIATNLCHAMDVEAQRKGDNEQEVRDSEIMIEDRHIDEEDEEKARPPPFSPTSSAADTGFETESNASDSAPYAQRRRQLSTQRNIPAALKKDPPRRREKNASGRSARIEKDVLLKMGVDPAMIGEIQRVLDTIAAEEENAAMKEEDARSQLFGMDEEDDYTDEEDNDAAISHAFGLRSSSPPPGLSDGNDDEHKQADEHEDPDAVILPEWHEEPLRQALRRRHAHVQDTISQRHTYEDQARDMANVLTQRQILHGNVDPADMFAVRVISLMITYGIGFILLLIVYKVMHMLFFA